MSHCFAADHTVVESCEDNVVLVGFGAVDYTSFKPLFA